MAFTALLTTICEVREGATVGVGGQTTYARSFRARADNCDRQNVQEQTISNGVSALSLAISPLGATSALASNSLFFLYANYPIDVQFGKSGTVLCNVRTMTGGWTFSAIFVTTQSNSTRVVTGLFGGSNTTVTVGM